MHAHCAGHFYLTEQRSSVWSPAESRNMNEACTVGIFDAHDLWHFLSAFGIFFTFMFILTLGRRHKQPELQPAPFKETVKQTLYCTVKLFKDVQYEPFLDRKCFSFDEIIHTHIKDYFLTVIPYSVLKYGYSYYSDNMSILYKVM